MSAADMWSEWNEPDPFAESRAATFAEFCTVVDAAADSLAYIDPPLFATTRDAMQLNLTELRTDPNLPDERLGAIWMEFSALYESYIETFTVPAWTEMILADHGDDPAVIRALEDPYAAAKDVGDVVVYAQQAIERLLDARAQERQQWQDWQQSQQAQQAQQWQDQQWQQ